MSSAAPTYVVRSWSAVAARLGLGALVLGVVAAMALLGPGGPTQVVWLGLVAVVWILVDVRRAATRLRVDAAGIRFGFPAVGQRPSRVLGSTWAHVQRVEVLRDGETVRVVLRHDAPLPDHVRGRIVDPARPDLGATYERAVPGLDPVRLDLAVRQFAPHVSVTTA